MYNIDRTDGRVNGIKSKIGGTEMNSNCDRLGRRKIGKVESKIGVGSTFTVTIPCRIASKDEAQVKRDTTMTVQCHGRIKKGCAGDYDDPGML